MSNQKQGLSARELLEETFNDLKDKLKGETIDLPRVARAVIANDSDWHRTRIGYTGYESAVIAEIGGRQWAIAFGTKCGQYPADPYNCDIAAVPVSIDEKSEQEMMEEVQTALVGNSYFRSSLIFAMADGLLSVSDGGGISAKRFLNY